LRKVFVMMTSRDVYKIDLRRKKWEKSTDMVAVEEPLAIYVNDEPFVTLLSSPAMKKELSIGHLMGEGIIKSINDLDETIIEKDKAWMKLKKGLETRLKAATAVRLITSACGSIDDFLKLLDRIEKPTVTSDLKVNARKILEMIKVMCEKSETYKMTRGVHSAALFAPDCKCISIAEDVGRHNAVDKVIGDAALKQLDFSQLILTSTGRQTADMVLKAARVGIPIVVSIIGPINSGIKAAEKTGVTLICFARRPAMKICTHLERIIIS